MPAAEAQHQLRSARAPSDGKPSAASQRYFSLLLLHWLFHLKLNKIEIKLLTFISGCCFCQLLHPCATLPGLEPFLAAAPGSRSSRTPQVTLHGTISQKHQAARSVCCRKSHWQKGESHWAWGRSCAGSLAVGPAGSPASPRNRASQPFAGEFPLRCREGVQPLQPCFRPAPCKALGLSPATASSRATTSLAAAGGCWAA